MSYSAPHWLNNQKNLEGTKILDYQQQNKEASVKMPKIRHLVIPIALQHKHRRIALTNRRRQKHLEESAICHQT
uniref:Ovule protein n=1 Tax=Meloidogyne hapla TaxID=6305 RepID=A0A1I8BJE2_MELHA